MIKPNELRPGNWVLYEDDGEWAGKKVSFVAKDLDGFSGWFVALGSTSVTIEDHFNDGELHVKGHPINELMLNLFGFKEAGTDDFHKEQIWKKEGGEFYYSNGSLFYYPGYGYSEPAELGNLEYVHQLQNLWFALTDQEL